MNDGVGRAETARDQAVSAKDDAEAAQRAAEESASSASRAAEVATEKKQAAEQAAQTATEKAQEATNAAQSAGNSANAASQSASDAATHDSNAEAWAVGQRNGQPVSSSDATYHNNAKYYSANADQKASAAASSESVASQSAQTATDKANEANLAAQTATEKANVVSQSAQVVAQDRAAADQSANAASQSAQTAVNKANEASQAAQTAIQKAQEAGASASSAGQSATDAGRYKQAIENIIPEAETRPPNSPATVSRTYDSDNNLIRITFGIPQGEKGETGVYVGTTPPDDPDVAVWLNPEGTPLNLDSKQNAPAVAGTSGQVLGLDNNLNPVWIDNVASNDIPVERGTGIGSVQTKSFTASNTTYINVASGNGSFAEGGNTKATGQNSHAEGAGSQAVGNSSHAEGVYTIARNSASHAEGSSSVASGSTAHAEGNGTTASGVNSHSEGQGTQAQATDSHAEGCLTIASGVYSHAEGNKTVAAGGTSHAEGQRTFSNGVLTHTEGEANFNEARNAHVQGAGNELPSTQGYAFVHGTYSNAPDLEGDSIQVQPKDASGNNDGPYTARTRGLYSEIVGNGTSDSNRSNAYALDWSGNGKYAGDVYVHAENDSTGGDKLATEDYVDDAVSHISAMSMHICSSQEYDSNTGVPTVANPDGSTFYLVPGGDSPNLYIEWVYINNAWEQFGSATIDIPVHDVQVNGTTVVQNGIANVPIAASNVFGVSKVDSIYGLTVIGGYIATSRAVANALKAGTEQYKPIVPQTQHYSAFYGLAKAAGDSTQSVSDNAVGTYTDEAKEAIQTMLDVPSNSDIPVENGTGVGSVKTKDFEYNDIYFANIAAGLGSFAEGTYNLAEGDCSHAEGACSVASGMYAHAEGYHFAGTIYLTGEENSTAYNYAATSVAIEEGCYITDKQEYYSKILSVDGTNNSIVVSKTYGQACDNVAFICIDGRASGSTSHAEGMRTKADGMSSHTEGLVTVASGRGSHAEGEYSQATGTSSHSEGGYTKASKSYSHAEGFNTIASGNVSHAEGNYTIAEASASHTEGQKTIAKGAYSHVEGRYNVEDSYDGFPEWIPSISYEVGDKVKITGETSVNGYICKMANSDASFVSSNWGAYPAMNYAHIVGNGTADDARSNAYALSWEGDGHYAGDIYAHCNADSSGGVKLATMNDIPEYATDLETQSIITGWEASA